MNEQLPPVAAAILELQDSLGANTLNAYPTSASGGDDLQTALPNAEHHPEEWGPSDDRRLTCSCGNRDPNHMVGSATAGEPGNQQGLERRE